MNAIHRVLDPNTRGESARDFCALGIMTKAPRAGEVKTRLVPPLSMEEAAALNICFLRDTAAAISAAIQIAKAARKSAYGVAVYTPPGAEEAYTDILPPHFVLIPQRGGSFGDRLCFAAEDLFKCGFNSVCLIDSDSPTVRPEIFAQAVQFLDSSGDRIVLGPSDDGGYYLIGLKEPRREMFERIDWSTERVFDQTLERAKRIGVEVELLPACSDVDDPATLRRLCNELIGEKSRDEIAPATRKFLNQIIAREGRGRIWPG
jgi:rSAM/selenodomain-associated transferase 1